MILLHQIPADAIAAALQRLEADSDSEDGDGGFTEAGSVWGGDEVNSTSFVLPLKSGSIAECLIKALLGPHVHFSWS